MGTVPTISRTLRFLREMSVALGVAWAVAMALLAVYQASFIYPGSGEPQFDPALTGLPTFKEAMLSTADGFDLRFWASPPAPGMPSLLVFHGNGASAGAHAFVAGPYVKAGYGVVMAEFRGYAGNPGTPAEAGIVMDAISYRAWMDTEWHEKSPVVMGISVGTGVAVALASERRVAALVLDAPFTSIPDMVTKVLHLWVPRFAYRSVYDSLVSIRSVEVPTVVLHGESDAVIPVWMGRELYAAAPCKYASLFLPDTGHTLLALDKSGRGSDIVLSLLADVRAGKAACKG